MSLGRHAVVVKPFCDFVAFALSAFQSSFHFLHKVDNFILLKVKNKLDTVISYVNSNPKHHDKYKFILKLI